MSKKRIQPIRVEIPVTGGRWFFLRVAGCFIRSVITGRTVRLVIHTPKVEEYYEKS